MIGTSERLHFPRLPNIDPLVITVGHWNLPCLIGKYYRNEYLSMAMLNYQRIGDDLLLNLPYSLLQSNMAMEIPDLWMVFSWKPPLIGFVFMVFFHCHLWWHWRVLGDFSQKKVLSFLQWKPCRRVTRSPATHVDGVEIMALQIGISTVWLSMFNHRESINIVVS